MDMAELLDSWSGVTQVVQELEESRTILVIKNKDGSPRMVFYNDMDQSTLISTEFQTAWHDIEMPSEINVQRELEKAGLKTMEVESTSKKVIHLTLTLLACGS